MVEKPTTKSKPIGAARALIKSWFLGLLLFPFAIGSGLFIHAVSVSTSPVLSAGSTTVRISPAAISVEAGQTFTVNVMIDYPTGLAENQRFGAHEFDLLFDPGIVRADSITYGDFP